MNPLEKFNYCPVCGSNRFVETSEKSKKCEQCGFEYFMNPSSANVAFIMNQKGELLVETRKNEPVKGTLDLPGGFCDPGETLEEGVRREVKEETKLNVTKVKYLFSLPNVYFYSGLRIATLDAFFLCNVDDITPLKAQDDAAECQWIPLNEIRTELFGLRSVREGLLNFIKLHKEGKIHFSEQE